MKSNKVEIKQRVLVIYKMLINGANTHEILQYASDKTDWNVSERSVYSYINKANKLFEKTADAKQNIELGKALNRYNNLYSLALREKDYKTCAQIQDKLSELMGLKKQKVDITTGGKPIAILGGESNVSENDSDKKDSQTNKEN